MGDVKDFVINHELLREDYRVDEGLVEFTHVDIEKRIKSLHRSCIVAIVGPYGSGKSTALHGIRQRSPEAKWLQFDAWRYPERKGLWDGLVIEVAKQLGKDKKTLRKVEGHDSALGKWGGTISEIFASAANIIPEGKLEWIGEKLGNVPTGNAKDASGEVKDVGAVATKVANNLFSRSPAKRVYEFEQILTDLLLSVEEDTAVIVVEDVDRSGSDGLHFLETLSFFLNNNDRLRKKKIIAVAPVSDVSYGMHPESYLKCVDYVELFNPRVVHIDNFLESVFGFNTRSGGTEIFDLPLPLAAQQMKNLLEGLFRTFPTQMNMRKLKMILREASSNFQLQQIDGFSPDWRVVIAVQSMKYLSDPRPSNSDNKSFYHFITRSPHYTLGYNTYFASFMAALIDDEPGFEDKPVRPDYYAGNMPAQGLDVKINFERNNTGAPCVRYIRDRATGSASAYIELQGFYFLY